MWKKQEGDADAQPEFALQRMPDLESVLIEAHRDREAEKGKLASNPQKSFADGQTQQSSPATMATYTDAVNEFTRNATAFIEQLSLLTKARDAYERAMRTSEELRKVLDAGDESLRALMTPLEQVINLHVVVSASDRKKPELAKVEPIRETDEATDRVKRFP
jgi:hypothetical protein